MRKENARRKSEAACWNYQNLIPHTVPTLYSSKIIVQKCVSRYQKNKWNHRNIQMSENLTPCSNDSPLWFKYVQTTHSAARASSSIFLFATFLLTLLMQSSWQESHFFHTGSVMLIQRLLDLLLELINALFFSWRPLWASTFLDIKFDTTMLQRFNRSDRSWIFKWLGHVGLRLYT